MTGRARVVALCLGLAVLGACVPWASGGERVLRVGAGAGVEQRVLAELAVAALRDAGIRAEAVETGGDTRALRGAVAREEIDLYWDYTGAAWSLSLGQQVPEVDPVESFRRVEQEDRGSGLRWLGPSRANATLALFVRAADVAEPDRTLSWLAGRLSQSDPGPPLRLCADPAFVEREGGLPSLAAAYAIDEAVDVEPADEDAAIRRVASGDCFAGLATATSGPARAAQLVPVADDLTVFPAFVVAPVVRQETLDRVPGLEGALAPALERLTTEDLAALNALAGEEQADLAILARAFLEAG
jgi:osmoprotectant transport system substrate-binding protein